MIVISVIAGFVLSVFAVFVGLIGATYVARGDGAAGGLLYLFCYSAALFAAYLAECYGW